MELRIVRLTDRFDEVCHFYGDLLGWPVTHEWPAGDGQGRGRLFGYGDAARVEFIEVIDGSSPSPLTGAFLSVELPGVAELRDRLVAAGVTLVSDLADTPWGHRTVRVLDPAGAEVVFFEHR